LKISINILPRWGKTYLKIHRFPKPVIPQFIYFRASYWIYGKARWLPIPKFAFDPHRVTKNFTENERIKIDAKIGLLLWHQRCQMLIEREIRRNKAPEERHVTDPS
jgi:hypothetical protein